MNLMQPDLRLSGTLVSLRNMGEQLSIRAFTDSFVYGVNSKGQMRVFDLNTGLYSEPKDIRDKTWCLGEDSEKLGQAQELDYSSVPALVATITRVQKWEKSGLPTHLVAKRGYETAAEANTEQEQFLIMLMQGQADGKQLTQGYRGLGGPSYLSFRRNHEGGTSYTPDRDDPFWADILEHLGTTGK